MMNRKSEIDNECRNVNSNVSDMTCFFGGEKGGITRTILYNIIF